MEHKPKFIYVMDPLCGWCYGFSPVIERIYEMYNHLMDFQLVVGGLMEGSRVGPLQEVAPYIEGAYPTVEAKCGVQFGELYFENIIHGNDILNSHPMNLILKSAQWLKPHRVFAAAKELQAAHFVSGIPCTHLNELCYAIERSGYAAESLIGGAHSQKAEEMLQADYQWVKSNGIQGFPCCIIETPSSMQMLSQGYLSFEELKQKIELLIPEITQYY